jgi:hypothetical protein
VKGLQVCEVSRIALKRRTGCRRFALTQPTARDAATADEAETLIGCMHTALKLLHRKGALPVALLQPYVLPITELQVAAALAGSSDGTVAGGGEGDVKMWDTAASAEAVKHTLMVDRRLSNVALDDPQVGTHFISPKSCPHAVLVSPARASRVSRLTE